MPFFPSSRVMSGFMELTPKDQAQFDRIKGIISNTYKSFGFIPIDTPIIERIDVLRAKNVGQTENTTLIYEIDYNEKQIKAGLRFDLTVPLARYAAEHYNDIIFPFRRMHIGKVYRRERAQKGRFREFYQCDIDVIGRGSLSARYDAEIPFIIYKLFKELAFGSFTIKINNRKLLNGVIESLDIPCPASDILNTIDKTDKITQDEFIVQLKGLSLDDKTIDTINRLCNIKGAAMDVLKALKNLHIDNDNFNTGLNELTAVINFMDALQVDAAYYTIDPSVVRGLDYYTGTVYETVLDDYPHIGAVCSGGRYDNLAGAYTKETLPGVGISIGLTRLFYQLKEAGLLKPDAKDTGCIVIPSDEGAVLNALHIADTLRRLGFDADVFLDECNYKKKLQYIKSKDAAFTVMAGAYPDKASLQYIDESGALIKEDILVTLLAERMRSL